MIYASKMDRYAACPGAYLLDQTAPKRPSGDAAKLGTAAAKLAEVCLKNGTAPLQYVGQEMGGEIVDVSMATFLGLYVDYCRKQPGTPAVEFAMKSSGLHLSGIPDFMSFDGHTLTIADLKYGFGWVDVEDNWQLMAYVALWKDATDGQYTPAVIRLAIVQPRANHPAGPVREWVIDGQELRAIYNRVANVTACALVDNPRCVAGTHCRYCPSIVGCNTNKRLVSECMTIACEATYQEMDSAGLAHELETLTYCHKIIGHRLTAVEEYTAAHISAGNIVPGYGYASTMGPMKWTSGDPIAQAVAMGHSIAKPAEPYTPKQAIDMGLMPENVVKMLSRRQPGAPKLKRAPMGKFKQMIDQAGKAVI